MRIMLVARVIPQHRPGGMPFVTQDRAEALAKMGHDVHVVTTASTQDTCNDFVSHCPTEGPIVYYTASKPQCWSDGFSKECERLYRALKPDILHSDSGVSHSQWWACKRVCVTMHGFGFGTFLTRWNSCRVSEAPNPDAKFDTVDIRREAHALAKAAVVIGVSKWEHRMLRDQYGLKQAKLVYNPIAPYFFEPPPMYDDGPTKREYFLCAAISQGHTRGFDTAKEAAKRAGVELRMAEKWDRRSMPAIYDGAIALVLPTAFAQGYDLCIAEARARGCPAIMSATGSYLDEARPWDRLVDIGDVEGLASAMTHAREYPTCNVLPADCADAHRPETHAENWLAACC